MANFCMEKQLMCNNCNEYGHCMTTACTNYEAYTSTITVRNIPTCAYCKYNDGNVYTSYPVQYKCTKTGQFHSGDFECDQWDNLVKNIPGDVTTNRRCEICDGEINDGINHYLCAKCRLKLHYLLYKDDDYGRGTWA